MKKYTLILSLFAFSGAKVLCGGNEAENVQPAKENVQAQAQTNNPSWVVNALAKAGAVGATRFLTSWLISKALTPQSSPANLPGSSKAPQDGLLKGIMEVCADVAVEGSKMGVDEVYYAPENSNASAAEKCSRKMVEDLSEATLDNAGRFFAGKESSILPPQEKVACKAAVPAIDYLKETGKVPANLSPIASSVKTLCKYECSIPKVLVKGVAGLAVESEKVGLLLNGIKADHRRKGVANMIRTAIISSLMKLQGFALGYASMPYGYANSKLTSLGGFALGYTSMQNSELPGFTS